MTKTKTNKMTTLYFMNYYSLGFHFVFLGLDASPQDCDGTPHTVHTVVASPAQIAKIERAIADGVRYEVIHVKGSSVKGSTRQSDTVRVLTYGTHQAELSALIRKNVEEFTRKSLSALDEADTLADVNAEPLAPSIHLRRVTAQNKALDYLATRIVDGISRYIDPEFREYPKRGQKSQSTP